MVLRHDDPGPAASSGPAMLRLNSRSSLEATLHSLRHMVPCAQTIRTSSSVVGAKDMTPHSSCMGIVMTRSHSIVNSALYEAYSYFTQ